MRFKSDVEINRVHILLDIMLKSAQVGPGGAMFGDMARETLAQVLEENKPAIAPPPPPGVPDDSPPVYRHTIDGLPGPAEGV